MTNPTCPAYLPLPAAGGACIPLSFRETSGGCFSAVLPADARSRLTPGGHAFLLFDRVGCRAEVTVSCGDVSVSRTHYGSFTDWCLKITDAVRADGPLTVTLTLCEDTKTLSAWQKAGIFGQVRLLLLPAAYLTDFYVRPVFSDGNWSFSVECPLSCGDMEGLSRRLRVTDPDGHIVLTEAFSGSSVLVPIPDAKTWSPASPALYRLRLELVQDEKVLCAWEKPAGLRAVQRDGNRLLLNGTPLKLKGLNYREPLPTEGFDPGADLELFRQANVNYLRSLHYPFSEAFLDLCDARGILVEQGVPAEGVGQTLPANQNAPALTPLFTSQCREMVLSGRSHPCILLWSLGSECIWGEQFRRELNITRALDPDRPALFHYPMTIPPEDWIPDVWSMQYGAWNLEPDGCYDQMVVFHTHGADNPVGYALGKAQDYSLPVLHDVFAPVPAHDPEDMERDPGLAEFWGVSFKKFWERIYETPGALGGAVLAAADEPGLPCGILDEQHRPKPEYWHVKMAYREDPFTLTKTDTVWTAENSRVRADLDPKTGLLCGLAVDGETAVAAGPFLHTGRYRLGPWKLFSLSVAPAGGELHIRTEGSYGTDVSVLFSLRLTLDGELFTDCRITALTRPLPHLVKTGGIGLDPGGLDEYGIRYLLPASFCALSWVRDGLWPSYPANHIGRPRGTARRENAEDFTSLKADIRWAKVCSDALGLQVLPAGVQSLRLALTPDPACVLDDRDADGVLGSVSFSGDWHAVEDAAGLINPTETMSRRAGDACEIRFCGTGLTVFGTTDRIRGICRVLIDGTEAARVSQHTPALHTVLMSRGYEKQYHKVLFRTEDLPFGEHICRIEVTGEKEAASQGSWISIDSAEIQHPAHPRQVSLLLLADYNYPRLAEGHSMRPAVLFRAGDELHCRLYPAPLKGEHDL